MGSGFVLELVEIDEAVAGNVVVDRLPFELALVG